MDTPRIYFAGKVEKGGYREKLFSHGVMSKGRHDATLLGHTIDYVGPFAVSCDHGCFHGATSHGFGLNNGRPVRRCNICSAPRNDERPESENYAGDCHEYCGMEDDCECCGRVGDEEFDGESVSAPYVVRRCLSQIYMSDIVYAWIDSFDCYGTLMEIGFASALGKKVCVEISGTLEGSGELWFMKHLPGAVVSFADKPLQSWPEEFERVVLTVLPFGRTMQ